MEKQYNIKASHRNYLKQKDLFQMIIITFAIYVIITIVSILYSGFSLAVFLWFSLTYIFLVGIALFGRYHTNSPLDNTIIHLEENQITRKGKELRTVSISFDAVSDVKFVKYGIILFDKNRNKLNISFAQNPSATEAGLLFIPKTIEDYEELKEYVLKKIK